MAVADAALAKIDKALVWAGFKQLIPISVFVAIFGAAFGLAASQAGLSELTILAMSMLVFAGASQFAALDLWGTHIPLLTMMLTVFAINARHLLMGASLYPWLSHLPPAKRYGLMGVTSDANWAMSLQAFNHGRPGFGILLGGGVTLWLFWVSGTCFGLALGSVMADPKSIGLDMVMGCFLLAMVVDVEKNWRVLAIWTVAALASLLSYWYLPENSHVVVGALAGGLLGMIWEEPADEH